MLPSEPRTPACVDPASAFAQAGAAPTPSHLRLLAVRALHAELVTFPKPGLVSPIDHGSHGDMDAATFIRSACSLRQYFHRIAVAGRNDAPFAALRTLGIAAEARMLRATGGVNTHRGAIFHLGLLVAAAARSTASTPLGDVVRRTWGPALAGHRRDPDSHGSRAGRGGALAEAVAGYPSVFGVALPAYRGVLAAGGSANQARVQAFFALVAAVDDTNLRHRGGVDALRTARSRASAFLDAGGVLEASWRQRALTVHIEFCRRGWSPGGSADLLAACVLVHSLSV